MLKPVCFAALGLGAMLAGPVQAAPPYPASTAITGLRWDVGSYRWTGAGGDIWPVTWAADGTVLTAWGDGVIGCRQKASYGVAAVAGDPPSPSLATRYCGPGPHGRGKIMAMVAAGSQLYARIGPQGTAPGYPVWRSGDGGRSWTKPQASLPFLIESFVQFGKGNESAPGGWIYALERRGDTAVHLLRSPSGGVQSAAAFEYFSGTAAAPAWSASRSRSRAVFTNPAGVIRPTITYVPGLGRFLLSAAHAKDAQTSGHRLGLFEAPAPWGPWRTVAYLDKFLGMRGGSFLGLHFPIKWQTDGGRSLWAVFSCHNAQSPGACGPYHDRFNLMKATLTVGSGR